MASLITQVDRTTGNYQQVFIYTLNASFSGVTGAIDDAQIRIFFPDTLDYYLGDYRSPVQSVSEQAVTGGTLVTYNFGAIVDLGVAVRLGIGVQFTPETQNGTTFLCTPELFINGASYLGTQAPLITLQAVPNFEIRRQVVLPSVDPSPGSEVYYRLTLQNFGDLGAALDDIAIVCGDTAGLTLDDTFPVRGRDTSSAFADTRSDGVAGVFSGNTLTLNLAQYKGEKYEFFYRARIDEGLLLGSELVTEATLTSGSVLMQTEVHDITLSAPIYDAAVSLYGPDYALPGEPKHRQPTAAPGGF